MPDPDQPTGPAPTFDLTYLEAEALRHRAGPKWSDPDTTRTTGEAQLSATQGQDPLSDRAEVTPADGKRANATPAWPRMEGTPASRLALTR